MWALFLEILSKCLFGVGTALAIGISLLLIGIILISCWLLLKGFAEGASKK